MKIDLTALGMHLPIAQEVKAPVSNKSSLHQVQCKIHYLKCCIERKKCRLELQLKECCQFYEKLCCIEKKLMECTASNKTSALDDADMMELNSATALYEPESF